MEYNEFIQSKVITHHDGGFIVNIDTLNASLFEWQKHVVAWSLRKGKSAIFADCGLGKTAMQLEWAHQVSLHTNSMVLILAPLAVSKQTQREGIKFGIPVKICKDQSDMVIGVNITNYEKLEHFSAQGIAGIVLDESSILKSFTGKTKKLIIDMFADTQYKLACTATPSPNDFMELGNHSEFLNIMSRTEMLATYFVHDGETSSSWRLKGHAESVFWKWISSWAVVMKSPSDIGFENASFDLPPLTIMSHIVETESDNIDSEGQYSIFNVQATTLDDRRAARKDSMSGRVDKVVSLVNEYPDDSWLIWVDFNAESDMVKKAIDNCVEVKGSDTPEHKENSVIGFADGTIKRLVTKPSICGFGINWQKCHRIIFCGLSDSYEMFYQSLRRVWRYGQSESVYVHVVIGDREVVVLDNIKRKESQADQMINEMIMLTKDSIIHDMKQSTKITENYKPKGNMIMPKFMLNNADHVRVVDQCITDHYAAYNADSCEAMQAMTDNSVDYSIFSPPFADLYTYSNSDRDLGNCKTETEFFQHFKFIVDQLLRVTKPGRLVSFHCMNLPTSKERDGFIGMRDLRGDLIKMFQESGFIYHSEVCIWKDPVTAMQRTKALGLLHKTIRKDSSMARQGIPDYLVTMRKPGTNQEPIAHTKEQFPVAVWQRYASPIWMDINQSDTLQKVSARESRDEKHICPLQLGVITRAINLWSNPGDLVFSPFMGIGSEPYQAVKMGRYGMGIELKASYYGQAVRNLDNAVESLKESTIFEII